MDQSKTISKNNNPKNAHDRNDRTKKPAKKTPRKITDSYLHNSGLYYLERFSSSAENFRQVMLRKVRKSCMAHPEQEFDACADMVDALVTKFIDLDLLNDQQYTRAMVTTLRRRGKSERYILGFLKSKGLDTALIQSTLEQYAQQNLAEDGRTDKDAALIFARKKRLGPYRRDKEKHTQKELGAFARAGFSYEIARKIIECEDEGY
jgi:regulatory protein